MEKKQEIKFDERNYRKHSKKNKALIKKSLEELGAGRSVVIDADDTLVAGNGVFEQAQALQMPVRVIETDGSELVVVKRTDIHTKDEKRRKLALADNAISAHVEWDACQIRSDFDAKGLAEWGCKLATISNTEKLSKLEFTSSYYTPKEIPNIKLRDCFDTTKFDAKIEYIKSLDLPQETKSILEFFAYRFIKIDFESIANYYAFCANEEEKKAIERLRLVLVDNGSIDGFVEDEMLRITEVMLEINE